MTTSTWASRPVPSAMSPGELAALVDRELSRADELLFTMTPREELDEIGRLQQLSDQVWVAQLRAIVAAHNRAGSVLREFASDEVGLAIGASPTTGSKLSMQALALAALPGMLEAVSAGMLTQRHALAVLRELDKVTLPQETRGAVVLILLARLRGQTPGELAQLTARLVLQVDLAAARNRQDTASAQRRVVTFPDVDGQGVVHARGPLAQVAAIRASLERWLAEHPKSADDPRSEAEREFDLFVALLTGGAEAGQWQAQIVVPFSTVEGGELELAEIPGFGPILPSTARDLAGEAEWSQVAVDEDGVVIAVSDPIPAPRSSAESSAKADPADEAWWTSMRQLLADPPSQRLMAEQLSSAAYSTPSRLRRYLQARDRHCVFPGCHRRITDVDHRIPWPLGPTTSWNLQLLCRHHHRAKQAAFMVELTADGDYLWTSRGGWQFLRERKGY